MWSGRHRVVEEQAVVLVRHAGLFLPALACRRRARDRAPAAGPASPSASASRRRVAVSAMSVISRVTISCRLPPATSCTSRLRDLGGDAGHRRRRVSAAAMSLHQLGRAHRLEPGQVGLGDDADQLAGLDDRDVADAVLHHRVQHVRADGRGRQGERVGASSPARSGSSGAGPRPAPCPTEIAGGDDARPAPRRRVTQSDETCRSRISAGGGLHARCRPGR